MGKVSLKADPVIPHSIGIPSLGLLVGNSPNAVAGRESEKLERDCESCSAESGEVRDMARPG